jgi:hypothetical protein
MFADGRPQRKRKALLTAPERRIQRMAALLSARKTHVKSRYLVAAKAAGTEVRQD